MIDGKFRSRDEPYRASSLENLYLNRIEKPYRKPTQVDKRKYAKVNGWDLFKELGKQVDVSSQYVLPVSHLVLKKICKDNKEVKKGPENPLM